MSLRQRTLISIGVMLVALVLVLYILTQVIFLRSFANLEEDTVQQHVGRVQNDLRAEMDALSAATADYAHWDDTYQFVQDGNTEYIDGNLMDDTLINLDIHLMLFVNTSGEIVFAKMLDPDTNTEIPLPDEFRSYLGEGSPLRAVQANVEDHWEGFIRLDGVPLLVAARPILTSDKQGPAQGVLLFGRFWDEAKVAALSEKLQLAATLYSCDQSTLPGDAQTACAALSTDPALFIQTLPEDRIAGYTLVSDITGQPVLLFRVDVPRTIYDQGRQTTTIFVIGLLSIGLLFGAVTLLSIEQTVLSRVAALGAGVKDIGQGGDIAARLTVTGRDELAQLSGNINTMLQRLHRAQQERWEITTRLETVIHNAPVILWAVDPAGKFTFFDGLVLRTLGLESTSVIGHTIAEVWRDAPADDRAQMQNSLQRALTGAEASHTLTAEDFTFDSHYAPLRDLDGQIIGVIGVSINISGQKRAERALHQSEERYRLISEVTSDYAFADRIEPDGTQVTEWVTSSAYRITGLTAEEWSSPAAWDKIVHPEDKPAFQASQQKLRSGQPDTLEFRIVRPGGKARWIRHFIRSIWSDQEQRITYLYGAGQDITELKQAEQQRLELAVEKERMRALSDFITAASHQFRTPLSIISTSLYLLEKIPDIEKRRHHIRQVDNQVKSIAILVKDLILMAGLDSGTLVFSFINVDLCSVVRIIKETTRTASQQKQLQLVEQLSQDSLWVRGDPDQLKDAITRIWENAILYTPDKGTITVRTYAQDEQVVIEISDTGIGIAEEQLPHIFERFYRSDQAGTTRGFGLGLSIAKSIIDKHAGRIEAESQLEKGSAFRIILPLLPAKPGLP